MEFFWKSLRLLLPIYGVLAVVISLRVSGLSLATLGLGIFATALLVTAPIWSAYWEDKLELPAYRRESLRNAELNASGHVLFLRPFIIDHYWINLQELIRGIVRAKNKRYAGSTTTVAIGNTDEGPIAKVASSGDDWKVRFRDLAGHAEAIIIVPVHANPEPGSGIVQEIISVIVDHLDKTIFVMPPRAVWDENLKSTPLAGQLERLWETMRTQLQQISSSLILLPYEAAGCFYTLKKLQYGDLPTKYPYSQEGAEAALLKVFSEEELKRDLPLRRPRDKLLAEFYDATRY